MSENKDTPNFSPGPTPEQINKFRITDQANIPDIRMELKPPTPEQEVLNAAEANRFYERTVKGLIETAETTTLPWVFRREVRRAMLDRFAVPAGYFDNYTDLHAFEVMATRARSLKDSTDKNPDVQGALGFSAEPWRRESAIPRQYKEELPRDKRQEYEEAAKERLPEMAEELESGSKEFALSKKLTSLYFSWISMATGQQLSQIYTETPIWFMPKVTDFADVLSMPAEIMDKTHDGRTLTPTVMPGYPREAEIKALRERDGLKDNLPLGEKIVRGVKAMYLISLSDSPEKVMEWKFKAEQQALNKLLLDKGFDPEYPDQRAAGIGSLNDDERKLITNAWWLDLGFKSEFEGRKHVGYPEMWVPFKARRGEEITRTPTEGPDFPERRSDIWRNLDELKKIYSQLSPLANPNHEKTLDLRKSIAKLSDQLRNLSIMSTRNREGELLPIRNGKGELETMINSLLMERDLGGDDKDIGLQMTLRGVKDFSFVWGGNIAARPQIASEKELVEENLLKFLGNDKLASAMSNVVYTLWGFKSKYGAWARDFDPETKKWKVDVEGWPYSDEMAIVMDFQWWQIYKQEAGGPEGSRGKFGPLMTDYLTYNVVLPKTTTIIGDDGLRVDVDLRDGSGRELLKIIDENGKIRPGRPDEGVVIGNYGVSLKQLFESGADLSDKSLWKGTLEDPYRRFLLRGFFAEGRSFDGSDLKTIFTRVDWKPDELMSDKFWEGFKLALRVGLRKEQTNDENDVDFSGLPTDEEGWTEVYNRSEYVLPYPKKEKNDPDKRNIIYIFNDQVQTLVEKLTDPRTPQREKTDLVNANSKLYADYQANKKSKLEDYIYKTWWKGVTSLKQYKMWDVRSQEVLNEHGQADIKSTTELIIEMAKAHGIELVSPKTK